MDVQLPLNIRKSAILEWISKWAVTPPPFFYMGEGREGVQKSDDTLTHAAGRAEFRHHFLDHQIARFG